jgi:hypothetical protein
MMSRWQEAGVAHHHQQEQQQEQLGVQEAEDAGPSAQAAVNCTAAGCVLRGWYSVVAALQGWLCQHVCSSRGLPFGLPPALVHGAGSCACG